MILSLVLDDRFMHPDNIADGYDLFTGKVNGPDNHYGEIHTGDAWIPARIHFCGEHPNSMPIALVIFLGINLIWTCMDTYPHCHLLSPCHVSTSNHETKLNFGDLYHSFLIYHTVHHHPKPLPIHMIVFKTSMIV